MGSKMAGVVRMPLSSALYVLQNVILQDGFLKLIFKPASIELIRSGYSTIF